MALNYHFFCLYRNLKTSLYRSNISTTSLNLSNETLFLFTKCVLHTYLYKGLIFMIIWSCHSIYVKPLLCSHIVTYCCQLALVPSDWRLSCLGVLTSWRQEAEFFRRACSLRILAGLTGSATLPLSEK